MRDGAAGLVSDVFPLIRLRMCGAQRNPSNPLE
jgi:hypothetical protein